MSSVTTFGAFTTARLGMYAAMKGLDVTGHNISNINTYGYSRQKLNQSALYLNGTDRYASRNDARVGSGVLCTGISQLRDPYLDIRYRNEMSSVGSKDSKLAGLDEITKILDEVGKGNGDGLIEKQISDLIEKLSALSDKTNMEEYQTLVRGSAESLVSLLNSYADRLDTVQANQIKGFTQDITRANEILKQIANYNDSIRKSEIHGDSALEQRDERNVLIDELSQYMKIDVTYETVDIGAGVKVQNLVIKMGDGNANDPVLVDGAYAGQVSIRKEPVLNPNWDINNPTSGQYMAAGGGTTDVLADATMVDSPSYDLSLSHPENRHGDKMPNGVAVANLSYVEGALQSTREMLTGEGEYTPKFIEVPNGTGGTDRVENPAYATSITKRGIPFYRKSMDALANKFADVLNGANPTWLTNNAGNCVDKDGKEIMFGSNPPDPGFPLPPDSTLLDPNNPANQGSIDHLVAQGVKIGGTLFSNDSTGDNTSGITAKNISISHSWSTNATKLANYTKWEDRGSTSNVNINHMITLIRGDQNYSPDDIDAGYGSDTIYFTGSFQKMFTKVCGTLANDVKATSTELQNYATSAEELDINRGSISGVDLNDEAANMMMYQKSYAAAARLMTTIDEALDKLINGTGVVGR